MALRDRMRNDWHELTLQERKAGMCAKPSVVLHAVILVFELTGRFLQPTGLHLDPMDPANCPSQARTGKSQVTLQLELVSRLSFSLPSELSPTTHREP